MYNLQVPGHGAAGGGGESSASLATTPRTPEILNSLIAMSSPFESAYARATHHHRQHHHHHHHHAPRLASSPPGGSDNSTSSSAGSGGGCVSPPSVQSTCSQLIKEGLKLTIQSKRRGQRAAGGADDGGGGDERKIARRGEVREDDDDSTGDGLTPEDEERRKRRRERNKIAATKCRLKKRERTVNLVQESEILENQNHDLKSQIQELETQRRRLVDMLSIHRPSCQKQLPVHALPDSPFPTTTYQAFSRPTSVMESGSSMFRRINVNASNYPRTKSSLEATTSYHRIEMSSPPCVEAYQRAEPDPYGRPDIYHSFEGAGTGAGAGEADTPLPPYCRPDELQGSPTFTQIGDFPPAFSAADMDRFVKPELPPYHGHGPAASYRPPFEPHYVHYEDTEPFVSTDFTSRSALAE